MFRFIALFLGLSVSSILFADGHGMPKSGKFDFHTGWKCNFNMKTLGDNHIQGFGDCSGVTFNDAGRVFQVVSGSNGSAYSGTGYTTNSGSYGLFLPDIGTILLNSEALSGSSAGAIDMTIDRSAASSGDAENPKYLYNAIDLGESFTLRSQETLTSDFVFVRARNSEFNYSENPSFISGSTGEVIYTYFIDNPTVYPTTVGMYNDSNDLLAVAKLSKPIQKDFTKEALIRVKLDF